MPWLLTRDELLGGWRESPSPVGGREGGRGGATVDRSHALRGNAAPNALRPV